MSTPYSTIAINPLAGQGVSEKLTKANFALWRMQVLAAVRGARLEGFLTGAAKAPTAMIKETKDGNEAEVSNPAYEEWVATDQQVLGYLISNMSSSIQSQLTACKTAAETWRAVEGMFSSMTRARAVNTRIALATMKKGNLSMAEYVGKMRSLADEITSTGKTIDDDKLVSYILAGLDYDYNRSSRPSPPGSNPSAWERRTPNYSHSSSEWICYNPTCVPLSIQLAGGVAHREDAVVEGARAAGLLVAAVGAPAGHLVNNMAPPTTTHVGRTTGPGVRFAKRRATRLIFVGTDLMKNLHQMKNMSVQLHPME
jgi:hypothetical protein